MQTLFKAGGGEVLDGGGILAKRGLGERLWARLDVATCSLEIGSNLCVLSRPKVIRASP